MQPETDTAPPEGEGTETANGADPQRPYVLIEFMGPDSATSRIEATASVQQVYAAAWLLNQWATELRMAQLGAIAEAQAGRIIVPGNRQQRRHPHA